MNLRNYEEFVVRKRKEPDNESAYGSQQLQDQENSLNDENSMILKLRAALEYPSFPVSL